MDLIVVVVAEARQVLRGKLCLAPRVVGVPFLSTALPNVCSGPSKLKEKKKKTGISYNRKKKSRHVNAKPICSNVVPNCIAEVEECFRHTVSLSR
jgi:hypothetical protein